MRFEFPLLLAFLVPVLGSSSAPRARPQAASNESEEAPEARRILHLRNGQTIRVLSRERKGVWEYHGKSGWKELAEGFDASFGLESDVLREWNAKKGATPPADLAARAKAADWALSAGLTVRNHLQADAHVAFLGRRVARNAPPREAARSEPEILSATLRTTQGREVVPERRPEDRE